MDGRNLEFSLLFVRTVIDLIMQDETVIPIEQISEIQGEIFKGLYE